MMEAMNPQYRPGNAKLSYISDLCSMLVNAQILYLSDMFFKPDKQIVESNVVWQG